MSTVRNFLDLVRMANPILLTAEAQMQGVELMGTIAVHITAVEGLNPLQIGEIPPNTELLPDTQALFDELYELVGQSTQENRSGVIATYPSLLNREIHDFLQTLAKLQEIAGRNSSRLVYTDFTREEHIEEVLSYVRIHRATILRLVSQTSQAETDAMEYLAWLKKAAAQKQPGSSV